jgi:hypothetical protein
MYSEHKLRCLLIKTEICEWTFSKLPVCILPILKSDQAFKNQDYKFK